MFWGIGDNLYTFEGRLRYLRMSKNNEFNSFGCLVQSIRRLKFPNVCVHFFKDFWHIPNLSKPFKMAEKTILTKRHLVCHDFPAYWPLLAPPGPPETSNLKWGEGGAASPRTPLAKDANFFVPPRLLLQRGSRGGDHTRCHSIPFQLSPARPPARQTTHARRQGGGGRMPHALPPTRDPHLAPTPCPPHSGPNFGAAVDRKRRCELRRVGGRGVSL
jgi:hypothetical protein